jgi:RimJ/RimL family protein N-acetyltransferase
MSGHHRIAYRLESERLTLRCWEPSDATELRKALDRSDAGLRPWIPFMTDEPRTLAETLDWLRGHRAAFDRDEMYRFAVIERASGALVGENMLLRRVGPEALELGYLTYAGHQRRGFAIESSAMLTRLAFECYGVRRMEIHHAVANIASEGIPRGLGFALEATRKDLIRDTEGKLHDCRVWCLHRSGFERSAAAAMSLGAFDGLERKIF